MINDPLAKLLSNMVNCQKASKTSCSSKPASKLITKVLEIMHKHHYIGKYDVIEDNKGGIIVINLTGGFNKCGVIKPRFSVKKDGYEKFEKRFLPSKDFGLIIVSTPKGIMTHLEAKEKGLGGKLIAYAY